MVMLLVLSLRAVGVNVLFHLFSVPCAGIGVLAGAWGSGWLDWWAYFEEWLVSIGAVLLTLSGYCL